MEAERAAAERSLDRLAKKAGLEKDAPKPQATTNEKTAAKEAPVQTQTKTAAEGAENDMKGSQLQTGVDKGDYSSQSAEVAKQNAETRQTGQPGMDEHGDQNMTQKNDYDNYTLTGPAKLAHQRRAVATVMLLAGKDPGAAAAFVRMAEGAGGADVGSPMGGKPDDVAAGEDKQDAAAAAPPAADTATADAQQAAAPDPNAAVQVKLQDKIKENEQQIDVEKQVNDQLKDVLNQSTASKPAQKPKKADAQPGVTSPTPAATTSQGTATTSPAPAASTSAAPTTQAAPPKKAQQTKQAVDRKDDGKEPPEAPDPGRDKVPFSAVDRGEYMQSDGDPDWTLYDESKEGSNTSPDPHSGQEFAESSERQYKLASVKKETVAFFVGGQKSVKLPAGFKGKLAALKTGGWRLEDEKGRVFFSSKEAYGKMLQAKKAAKDEADKKTKEKEEKEKKEKDAARKQAAGEHIENGMETSQADDTVRYEGEHKGDTGEDLISGGNTKTLDSPDTSAVVDEARSFFDKRHNEDTKGSTVASKVLSKEGMTKVVALLKDVDDTFDRLGQVFKLAQAEVASGAARKLALSQVASTGQELRAVGNRIEAGLKATGTADTIRKNLMASINTARPLVKAAKMQMAMVDAMVQESRTHRARFARLSPAFKLAAREMALGLIGPNDLPVKVSEYMKLDPEAVKVVTAKVEEMASRLPARRGPGGGEKTASRIPHIDQNLGSKDELDGMFDD